MFDIFVAETQKDSVFCNSSHLVLSCSKIIKKKSYDSPQHIFKQRRKNPKLSGQQLSARKNFPDEVRETVSHDKPKKRTLASHNIAEEYVMNVLSSHLGKSGQF